MHDKKPLSEYRYYAPGTKQPLQARRPMPLKPKRRLAKPAVFAFGLILFFASIGIASTTANGKMVIASAKQVVTGSSSSVNAPVNTLETTLPKSLAGIMATKDSTVDVAVYDSKTHQTIHYSNAATTYNTASIVKLSILEELLLQDQNAGEGITDDQLAEATPMIENSDNDAATDLWQDVGAGTTMQKFFNQVGASSTTVNAAGHWGLTQTTALDQLKILKQFAYPSSTALLNTSSISTITSLLAGVETDQSWGVSGGTGSATVLLKNGWLQDTDGWDVNSIGHVTNGSVDYTISILSKKNDTEQAGISTTEALSASVYSAISTS